MTSTINPNKPTMYYESVTAKLRTMPDLHIDAIVAEIRQSKVGEVTNLYIDHLLQTMVAHGATKESLIYGVPEVIEVIQKAVLAEGTRRWQGLRASIQDSE